MTTPSGQSELIERLRKTWPKNPSFGPVTTWLCETIHKAADRIEALEAQLAAGTWEDGMREAAGIAAEFKNGEPVDDKRDDGSRPFGFGVDVASDHISKRILSRITERPSSDLSYQERQGD